MESASFPTSHTFGLLTDVGPYSMAVTHMPRVIDSESIEQMIERWLAEEHYCFSTRSDLEHEFFHISTEYPGNIGMTIQIARRRDDPLWISVDYCLGFCEDTRTFIASLDTEETEHLRMVMKSVLVAKQPDVIWMRDGSWTGVGFGSDLPIETLTKAALLADVEEARELWERFKVDASKDHLSVQTSDPSRLPS